MLKRLVIHFSYFFVEWNLKPKTDDVTYFLSLKKKKKMNQTTFPTELEGGSSYRRAQRQVTDRSGGLGRVVSPVPHTVMKAAVWTSVSEKFRNHSSCAELMHRGGDAQMFSVWPPPLVSLGCVNERMFHACYDYKSRQACCWHVKHVELGEKQNVLRKLRARFSAVSIMLVWRECWD